MTQPMTMTTLSASLLVAFAALALPAQAAEVVLTVTTLADNPTTPSAGSLRAAINAANADTNNSYVINFNIAGGGTINLGADAASARMLPMLTNPNGISINGANLAANGAPIAINARGGDRIFFVGVPDATPGAVVGSTMASTKNTSFSISNLTLQNGLALGGRGTSGGGGGGGGAGLGGAIFVNAGNLTIREVTFSANRATGGFGGNGIAGSANWGGGGGMGGNGVLRGGGGGFGRGAGGAATTTGSEGAFTGGASGGGNVSGSVSGGASGGGGAGLSGGTSGGGGGVGGGNLGNTAGVGGAGGFGGGGGGGTVKGGNGGYGGGGGGSSNTSPSVQSGGNGGFGGGGGTGRGPATGASGVAEALTHPAVVLDMGVAVQAWAGPSLSARARPSP